MVELGSTGTGGCCSRHDREVSGPASARQIPERTRLGSSLLDATSDLTAYLRRHLVGPLLRRFRASVRGSHRCLVGGEPVGAGGHDDITAARLAG
jgi:hypothetical protein